MDPTRIPRIMDMLEALWYDNPELSFFDILELAIEDDIEPHMCDECLECALYEWIAFIGDEQEIPLSA